jgi:hypothetical protein
MRRKSTKNEGGRGGLSFGCNGFHNFGALGPMYRNPHLPARVRIARERSTWTILITAWRRVIRTTTSSIFKRNGFTAAILIRAGQHV